MKKSLYTSAAFVMLFSGIANAQEKNKENIGTERVTLVSPYQASVNDAFKIKDLPSLDDEDNNQKKPIKYTIFSFPVASTFAPDKGEAATVDNDTLNRFYNNYAMLSYGNYGTFNGELGIVEKLDNNMYVGGILSHLSSSGGIKNIDLDDKYAKTGLDLTLGSKNTDNNWNLNFGVNRNQFNWYGLAKDEYNFSGINLADIDVKNEYTNIHAAGKFENNVGVFESVDVLYKYFWDKFDAKENRFYIKPKFNIELENQTINVVLNADYLNTTFGTSAVNGNADKYSFLGLSVEPSIRFDGDNYNIQLGAGVGSIIGKSNGDSENTVLIYPKVKANIDLVKDIVIAYAGADGGFTQNSYADISEVNPFIAPVFEIRPTRQLYDLYAGLKGKLYHNASYNIRLSYKSEEDKMMFVSNPMNYALSNREGYQYGNSFKTTYDLVNTFSAFGEINLDFSENVTIAFSGEYNKYKMDVLGEAYNLPDARIGGKIHIDFNKQWFAGTQIYYVGQRFDLSGFSNNGVDFVNSTIELKSYADVNAYVGYRPTDKWTAFIKGNNLFDQKYQQWKSYQVQGIQVMLGAMYKFDF
ncbi:TonB-dependent receptor [Myroides ceti]|uniref:TonB-dependent receptor n=1 Tax=Paenimyroides ceti TaxID=395087 RepID=A0ABT8CTK4_9FLAO|nr:TonB-dependent receptor [Paenimyroides ceti]MDN3706419.1 TonB-dependent receptor [Paenimyroides ceti]